MRRSPAHPKKSAPALTATQKELEAKQRELIRRKEELEQRLVKIPLVAKQSKKDLEKQMRQRARQAGSTIRTTRRPATPVSRQKSTPLREAKFQRIRFLLLLCAFGLIIFLLLRTIPAG